MEVGQIGLGETLLLAAVNFFLQIILTAIVKFLVSRFGRCVRTGRDCQAMRRFVECFSASHEAEFL